MIRPTGNATHLHFFPDELVRICVPAESEIAIEGRIAATVGNTLSIVLNDEARQHSDLLPIYGRFIICKTTPLGMLEIDADGHSQWMEEKLTLQVTLLGTPHNIQRRASVRIELRSEARYCDLSGSVGGTRDWKTAELHDVSLGGAALLMQDDTVEIGHELLLEFALINMPCTVSSAVRRIEAGKRHMARLYALEFLNLDRRQQNRMARAMFQLQAAIINSRVKLD